MLRFRCQGFVTLFAVRGAGGSCGLERRVRIRECVHRTLRDALGGLQGAMMYLSSSTTQEHV